MHDAAEARPVEQKRCDLDSSAHRRGRKGKSTPKQEIENEIVYPFIDSYCSSI